jgi:hypothetical protein
VLTTRAIKARALLLNNAPDRSVTAPAGKPFATVNQGIDLKIAAGAVTTHKIF